MSQAAHSLPADHYRVGHSASFVGHCHAFARDYELDDKPPASKAEVTPEGLTPDVAGRYVLVPKARDGGRMLLTCYWPEVSDALVASARRVGQTRQPGSVHGLLLGMARNLSPSTLAKTTREKPIPHVGLIARGIGFFEREGV